jgi:transcriptional regulator with GAF, ATPase, and Fis domain
MKPHPLASLYAAIPELARQRLKDKIATHAGNVSATARSLGLTYTTVNRWVRDWGLAEWLAATYPAAGRIRAANRARHEAAP